MAASKNVGIAVMTGDRYLYKHSSRSKRIPASNQKLLMTMALFDHLDPESVIETTAVAQSVKGGRVIGDLWLVGRGDPAVTGGGQYGKDLPFKPTRLSALAKKIERSGITRITGSVRGVISYFAHDWYAPGWRSTFPAEEVQLPSALTFEANVGGGKHISDPEFRAAKSLTRKLRAAGVRVKGKASTDGPPQDVEPVASVSSQSVLKLVRFTNKNSINFFAEMFGKRLGVEANGQPGTIASGADAIEDWAGNLGVTLKAFDSSGLSYSNRASPNGLVKLLDHAAAQPGSGKLRSTLPTGGEGTLANRLKGVEVRAKTGTLNGYSTLSGYVYLERSDQWASFSIMSQGMAKSTAVDLEDRIVRLLEARAR